MSFSWDPKTNINQVNFGIKSNQDMSTSKWWLYPKCPVNTSYPTDSVEISTKEQKEKWYQKYKTHLFAAGAAIMAVGGLIIGKKKLDLNKLKRAEAEARRIAEEKARETAEKARIEAEEKANSVRENLRIEAERKAKEAEEKVRLEAEKTKEAERLAQIRIKQEKITHNKQIFGEFLQTSKYDSVISRLGLYDYGKEGLPLKYSRDSFLADLKGALESIPESERAVVESKFNIKLNPTTFNDIGVELEQIPTIPAESGLSEKEKKIAKIIRSFTQENEVLVSNKEEKEVLDAILQEIPEFTAIIGKKQHGTHEYSVDIHTLRNLKDNLINIRSNGLNEDSKTVLKYSTLLHDLGKGFIGDSVPDHGHAVKSVEIAKSVLERLELKPEIKERILKQIENHHWFEKYNKGEISAEDIVNLFGTKQDIEIAEIMARSDFKNVSRNFHYGILNMPEKGEISYCRVINEKFAPIDNIINTKIAQSKGLKPDRHGIMPISCDEEYFEIMDKLHDKRFRTIYCMGHVQNKYSGPRILEGSSIFADKNYVSDIPDRMTALPAYIGVNNGSSNNNYEIYKELNVFLAKNKDVYMSPIAGNVQIWSEEAKQLLKEHLVNMDSETAKEYIRAIDYSLKALDKEFGKYEGIVYRNGHFSADGGQFFSASKRIDLHTAGSDEGYHVIKTKNGHKINDFQKKYYNVHEDEKEILLPRDTRYKEVTNDPAYQEERMKLAKERYEYYKSMDEEFHLSKGEPAYYNYSFEDILAKTHVWEEI